MVDIVYLKDIVNFPADRSTRNNLVFLVGNYLYTIWTYRNIVRHQHHRNQDLDPSIAIRRFIAATKELPFDNG
ncbi:unnamed protein product [Adineta steineri]|uniref:Uncharacterized protein n=1 Tax=Adineta steineri TaxID=433720 RepID=A0A816GWE4_9BILA|nr:unnamed protein product [Adineta steineri]CAF1679160.1 unnamed protein product [Adineta steineri]